MLNFSRAQEFLVDDFNLENYAVLVQIGKRISTKQVSWIIKKNTQRNCIIFHRLSGQDVIWIVFH